LDTMVTNISIMLFFLFLCLGMGMWIWSALYGVAIFSLMFLGSGNMHGILGGMLFNSINSYPLVAIPLFIVMGELLIKSGSSTFIFRGVKKIFSVFPGGMLHSNIISCSIFAACSGSSTATTLAIGEVSYPELIKAGYDRKIVLGSIAAGGSLGILIPPSIIMIIYGSLTCTSIGKLFVGGVVPGIILAGSFLVWIGISGTIHPGMVPERSEFNKQYLKNVFFALKDLWPVILLVGFVMVSIYGGYATPTEAAAVGAVFSLLVVAFVYRRLTWKVVVESLRRTMFLTCMMMICIIGARALGMALSMLEVPQFLSNYVSSLEVNRYIVWAALILIYMILGCLIDGIDLMLVTTPVFYPIVVNVLGFDPIWYGVVLVIILEISLLTPPVGFNLYITHGVGGGKRLQDTILGVLPFLILMLVVIALLSAFPELVTYLPSRM